MTGAWLAASSPPVSASESLLDGDASRPDLRDVVFPGHQVTELPLLDVRAVVDHFDGPPDVGGRADHGLEGPLHFHHDGVDCDHVERIGHRRDELAALLPQGDQAEPLGDALGQQAGDLGIDFRGIVQPDVLDGQVLGQNVAEGQIVEQVQTDEHFAEAAAFLPLLVEGLEQFLRGDQAFADQEVPDLAAAVGFRD